MPAAAEKFTARHGILLGLETSYGSADALSASSDAILTDGLVQAAPDWAHAGEHDADVAEIPYARGPASGAFVEGVEVPVLVRGANVAYSSSEFPRDIHELLRICGFSVATSTTSGSESQTYDPETDDSAFASGVMEMYDQGEKMVLAALYGSLSFEVEAGGFMRATPTLSGIVDTLPTDASVPDLSSAIDSFQPPKAVGLSFNIGNYTAPRVRSISFDQNRQIGSRLDLNESDAHAGFAAVRSQPELSVTLEASALQGDPFHASGGIDPYELFAQNKEISTSFSLGSTQYNRLTATASQAQLAQPPEKDADAEGVALWNLTFQLNESGFGSKDYLQLVFD